MRTDPVKNLDKTEFVPVHGTGDERVSVRAADLDVIAVTPEEDIGGGESDALIAAHETVVVAERFCHHPCRVTESRRS